ncbi:MAG: PQQ-binding-like beta-propeller repeat protein [Verrucomicrobiales bacterium]
MGTKSGNVSMMEDFGRLTFPNGRVGAPVIEGNLVIIQGITANWGAEGPPRNRYYAFDKASGKLVWSSTPGVQPVDSSWSTPYVETRDGKRIFYAGTGCGNIVAVNALNGKSYWRFQASKGGVNCSPVVHGDKLIYIHGVENLDTTETGRMVAIKIPSSGLKPTPPGQENAPLPADAEVWRLPVSSFSSSPVLVGDRVYQLTETGSVLAVDANTGKLMWEEKLAPANVHSSVTAAGGLLFCPVENGNFYVLKDGGDKAEKLSHVELEGNCLGAPAVWGGHVFVETTKHLYAFKIKADKVEYHAPKAAEMPKAGPAAALQAVPGEAILAPGGSQEFAVHKVDANGNVLGEASGVSWAKFVPPTAKVKAEMDAAFDGGKLAAGADAKMSAGAFKATADGLSGTIRGRVLPKLPYTEDFESYENDENPSPDGGATFAYPPLPWIGARFKWEIREIDGTKALTKTLDRLILQRAMTFIADTESSDYTVQADIMTDGNRRVKSDVGLINQRYIIALKGNANKLEVFSNYERFRHDVSFKVEANKWYTMKTAVEAKGDGSGVIRAKVWERGTDEPEAWTIEVPHDTVHQKGAPGIYGFSPQSQKRVYVDNIKVTPNK